MVWRAVRLATVACGMWTLGTDGAAAQWCVRGVAGWDTLRIRSAPSPQARQIGAIAPNACGVAIVGACRGAWCPVAWRGQRGWSNTVYLTRGGGLLGMLAPPPWAAPPRILGGPRLVSPPRERMRTRAATRIARPAAPRPPGIAERPAQDRLVAAPPAGPPARETQPPQRAAIPAPPSTPPAPSPAPPEASPAAPVPSAGSAVVVPPAPTAHGEVCVINVAKGDTLKVRAGPGPDQTLRFGFPPGACGVRITGPCTDGWCPVEYRSYRGWAEQRFLK